MRERDEVNKRGKLVQTLLYYESRLNESRKRQKICTEARKKLLKPEEKRPFSFFKK
jgi:hypothetical protein